MKVLEIFIFVGLLAYCQASKIPTNKLEHLIPSFATGYIIKGEDAVAHIAPYIVSLSSNATNHRHICGGTLINKKWILTAAHCIPSNAVGMGVIAGLHQRDVVDEKTQSRVVDFGKIHESYTGGVGPYDIALLHVSKPFEINKYVQPAILPATEEIHSGTMHLYGWGQPKAYIFTGAKTLQTVETQIVEYNQCKSSLPENAPLYPSNLCSDSMGKGISACNGDSGGPLIKQTEGGPSEIVGIVSWGYIPCGTANLPSIYTRVSGYIEWIAKILAGYY